MPDTELERELCVLQCRYFTFQLTIYFYFLKEDHYV